MMRRAIKHIRRREVKHIASVQHTMLKSIHEYMGRRGFVQIMPVILSRVTDPLGPDPGSSVIKTGVIEYYGQKLKLTQSMILHKQMVLATGLKKIYVVSPNVRLERKERAMTGRHCFEFSQVDFEIAHGKMRDVFDLMEGLVRHVIRRVKKECHDDLLELGREILTPKAPFKVYTTHELEEKYGREWEVEASGKSRHPFFATCFKREFYDKEDDKKPGHFLNYDMIWPEGYGEALSGGEREYEYERIVERMRSDGIKKESYREYLELAKEGLLLPSAGAGFGVERMLRFITGKGHIRDVQIFPRIPGERVFV